MLISTTDYMISPTLNGEDVMGAYLARHFKPTLALAVLCTCVTAVPSARSADAPLTFEASPDVYKLVQENEYFRVIEGTWQPGQKDAMHSHTPFVIHWLTDCQLSAALPDGKSIEGTQKAGSTQMKPAVPGHIATNMGKTACRALFVERK